MDKTCIDEEAIDKYLKDNLPIKKQIHTKGVMEVSKKLAGIYGVDEDKAALAAKCHDLCKGWSDKKMNAYVREHGLEDKYLNARNISHSKAAAILAREKFHINDEDIINAISYHTTGREDMKDIEKIVYIADAIEPNRKPYPKLEQIRKTVYKDLDKACLISLKSTRDYLKKRGIKDIDEDTQKAIAWLEKEEV